MSKPNGTEQGMPLYEENPVIDIENRFYTRTLDEGFIGHEVAIRVAFLALMSCCILLLWQVTFFFAPAVKQAFHSAEVALPWAFPFATGLEIILVSSVWFIIFVSRRFYKVWIVNDKGVQLEQGIYYVKFLVGWFLSVIFANQMIAWQYTNIEILSGWKELSLYLPLIDRPLVLIGSPLILFLCLLPWRKYKDESVVLTKSGVRKQGAGEMSQAAAHDMAELRVDKDSPENQAKSGVRLQGGGEHSQETAHDMAGHNIPG